MYHRAAAGVLSSKRRASRRVAAYRRGVDMTDTVAPETVDAVVVGSGFGASVTAFRLAGAGSNRSACTASATARGPCARSGNGCAACAERREVGADRSGAWTRQP